MDDEDWYCLWCETTANLDCLQENHDLINVSEASQQ